MKALVFLSALFLSLAASAQSYQDPSELQARADRYNRKEQQKLIDELKQIAADDERNLQASGGRFAPHPGLLNILGKATGQDVSQAYWQAKRMKNGKYKRGENMALISGRGFYCFQTGMGFTRAWYSCYYDNGAPYISFEHEYKSDGY